MWLTSIKIRIPVQAEGGVNIEVTSNAAANLFYKEKSMHHLSLSTAWDALPHGLGVGLLRDSSSREQRLHWSLRLLETASSATCSITRNANVSSPEAVRRTLHYACDLLSASWEASPEDKNTAAQMLSLHRTIPFLSPGRLKHLAAICASPTLPEAPEPEAWPVPLRFLGYWRAGLRLWRDGEWADALACFQAVEGGWLTPRELAGHCLCRLGRREEALALWRSVLGIRPWHANLIQSLHDHLRGFDAPPSAEELPPGHSPVGATAALLYSWNKADLLHASLASLTASLPDVALIVCLDNGSTDATSSVLNAWKDRLGPVFLPVSLPVNIGAPAARNWLMQLPEVRRLPFAAYLDDDAQVPPDWLRHLARAVQVRPDASTWGCRVVDASPPRRVQAGPLHLRLNFAAPDVETAYAAEESPDVAFSLLRTQGEPFTALNPAAAATDYGQWDFLRPCASVTGCCHLFRTAALLARGGFTLSLSPSQYDDLEHDLRALDQGATACWTGFCTVLHAKDTGGATHLSGAAYGNGLGNKYKLHGLYDAARATALFRRETAALEADLTARLEVLDSLC